MLVTTTSATPAATIPARALGDSFDHRFLFLRRFRIEGNGTHGSKGRTSNVRYLPRQAVRKAVTTEAGTVRKLLLFGLVGAVALLGASVASAGSERGNTLSCFSGTEDGGVNGVCRFTADGAVLSNVDGDADPFDNYSRVSTSRTRISTARSSTPSTG